MTTGPESRRLRLLLDSADTRQWRRLLPLGIFHGVTTNPLLLARAGLDCTVRRLGELAATAAALGAREIHLQAWGEAPEELAARGRELGRAEAEGLRVLVKVPGTWAGLLAAAELVADGHAVTLTAVHQPGQVLAAAALGAAYAAPYLGRLDDAGRDGMAQILTMHGILRHGGAPTRLLVASLRTPDQVVGLAARGLDTFTLAPGVVEALLQDDLSDRAAAEFLAAARVK